MLGEPDSNEHRSEESDAVRQAEQVFAEAREATSQPDQRPIEDRLLEAEETVLQVWRAHPDVEDNDLHGLTDQPGVTEYRAAKARLLEVELWGRQVLTEQVRRVSEWVREQNLPWRDGESGRPIAYHYDAQSPIDAAPLRLVVTVATDKFNKGDYDVKIAEYARDPVDPNNLSNHRGTTDFEYHVDAKGNLSEEGMMSAGSRGHQSAQNYSQMDSSRQFDIWTNTDFRGKKSYPLGQARRMTEMLRTAQTQLVGQEKEPGFVKRVANVEPVRPLNPPPSGK